MLRDPLVLGQFAPQPISHAQERTGTAMFEDRQTSFEHLVGKTHACFLDGFEQLSEMFCRMGKIQDAHSVGPVLFGKGLTPICSIRDGTDLLCFSHLPPLYLHACQLGKGGGISSARKIGELTNVDLRFSISAALRDGFPNRDSAHLDPLFVDQGNHGPIDTQNAALERRPLC